MSSFAGDESLSSLDREARALGDHVVILERGLLWGQVVKRYATRRVRSVEYRVVRGTKEAHQPATGLAA